MTEAPLPLRRDRDPESGQSGETPRHGNQGDRGPRIQPPEIPASVSICISRETGARGASVAKRIGAKLGWQVYSQDLMEYIAQESNFRQTILENLSPLASQWVEDQLNRILKEQNVSRNPMVLDLARIVLSLGAQGEVILLGRGAGYLLPRPTTVHARLVAPLEDRIAYMSQWLRLTEEEAADQVRKHDGRRGEFIATHFHRRLGDVHQYDLVLNSSLLGEELCAELIIKTAQAKLATRASATE